MNSRMQRGAERAALLGCALLLAACAAKPPRGGTKVTLLPQADGTPSAVIVRPNTAAAAGAPAPTAERLDAPYQTASVGRAGPVALGSAPAEQVHEAYAPLFTTAPPPPASFVLYFRTGTTQLTPESQQAIQRVIRETLSRSGAEIVLIGHTDTTSSGEANDALSMRRAIQVREMFLQRGFPPALIEATGRGERELAVPTRDNVDEPRNRRVQILVR
ncbi:OmpA family protein [Xylophilus sp. GOD-11R]|uniref:OmpA family protein n=1 Tax=Xylophilus sp. GOD-11R TaxID=3089814 RepID=UPI00298C2952|nr:OmpA family protein [Xylophilus sp. GOD-11R]WPB59263.1 OmpA family protein [Xylophilus sp. GOD-11R]